MTLNRAQRGFMLDEKPIVGFQGGWGSGKTHVGVLKKIGLCMMNSGCASVAVEPTYRMLEDIMIPRFDRFLRDFSIPFHESKTNKSFSFPNNHTLYFRSGEKPERLEGMEYSDALVDEGALCKDELFLRLKGRVRDKRAKRTQINITFTPDGCNGYAYDTFGPGGSLKSYRGATDDNLVNLGDGYLTALEELPPDLQAQYRRGEFVDLRTPRVYGEFNREKNVGKFPLDRSVPVWIGLDFNVNPGMHFFAAQEHGQELWCVKEWFLPRGSTQEVAGAIKAWKDGEGLAAQPRIVCDAAGRAKQSSTGWSDVDILERAGFTCYWQHIRAQSDKHNPVKAMLWSGRLKIDAGCSLLIDSFLRYSFREGSQVPIDDKWKHMMDAIGYLTLKLRPLTRPSTLSVG